MSTLRWLEPVFTLFARYVLTLNGQRPEQKKQASWIVQGVLDLK